MTQSYFEEMCTIAETSEDPELRAAARQEVDEMVEAMNQARSDDELATKYPK